MFAQIKPLAILLLILFLILQYKLWFAHGGFLETRTLKQKIAILQKKDENLSKQNAILMADINALKNNNNAIESRARNDLGMIKKGETFYQVVS